MLWETIGWSSRFHKNYHVHWRQCREHASNSTKKKWKMSTCNQLDLETPGSQPIMPDIFLGHCCIFTYTMVKRRWVNVDTTLHQTTSFLTSFFYFLFFILLQVRKHRLHCHQKQLVASDEQWSMGPVMSDKMFPMTMKFSSLHLHYLIKWCPSSLRLVNISEIRHTSIWMNLVIS